jgi:hypothetical protein
VLQYPETGIYARELFFLYKGSLATGFMDALKRGNLVDFNLFLANTPRLETIRFQSTFRGDRSDVLLPIEFFKSLSSLASLRYLHLGEFDMHFDPDVPHSFPRLHQVRILRYTSSSSGATYILGDYLLPSMPNIHALHITNSYSTNAVDEVLDGIEVRCPLFLISLVSPLSLCLCLTGNSFRDIFS